MAISDKLKTRIGYWLIILGLLAWAAHLNEENKRYEYADRYLRADNAWLRARLLGLD